jgi:transposase
MHVFVWTITVLLKYNIKILSVFLFSYCCNRILQDYSFVQKKKIADTITSTEEEYSTYVQYIYKSIRYFLFYTLSLNVVNIYIYCLSKILNPER